MQVKVESGIFSGRQWIEGNSIEILGRGKHTFSALFDEDLKGSEQITEENIKNRSLWYRISGWAISKVLGPYI